MLLDWIVTILTCQRTFPTTSQNHDIQGTKKNHKTDFIRTSSHPAIALFLRTASIPLPLCSHSTGSIAFHIRKEKKRMLKTVPVCSFVTELRNVMQGHNSSVSIVGRLQSGRPNAVQFRAGKRCFSPQHKTRSPCLLFNANQVLFPWGQAARV